ncbi:hypothetical protein DH2020_023763 [Rehmannia glutinosa]|uniref:PB1-like domain-containing protein n=1 Tax=Rehmannia glutinosa TaxID=99300 RepID=A0ABR0WBA7_REHGL
MKETLISLLDAYALNMDASFSTLLKMGSTFYVGEKMGVSHIDYCDSDEMSLLEIISMANELGLKGFKCFHVSKGGVNNCMDILAIQNDNDAMKLVDFIDQNRMVGVFVEYETANVHVSEPMNENVTTQDLPNIEEPLPYWGDMENSDMDNDHMDNIDEHQGNEVDIEEQEGNENVHGIENDEVSDSDFEQSVGSDSEFSDEFVDSECEFSDEDDRMFDDHIDNEVEWGGLEMNNKKMKGPIVDLLRVVRLDSVHKGILHSILEPI